MGTVTACLGAVPLSIMHLEEDRWHFRFWGFQTQISAPHAESRWQELSASIIVWTNSSKKSLSIYLSIYPSIIYLSSVYHLLLVPFLWRTLRNKISLTCSAGGKKETLISCPPPPPCLHPFAPLTEGAEWTGSREIIPSSLSWMGWLSSLGVRVAKLETWL